MGTENLYRIISAEKEGDFKTTYFIEVNASNEVFRGHFPGNPVLPGVCTIQIIKELLEKKENKELFLVRAGTIKFQSFINPEINKSVRVDIQSKLSEHGTISCNSAVYGEGVNYCSFKGEFEIRNG